MKLELTCLGWIYDTYASIVSERMVYEQESLEPHESRNRGWICDSRPSLKLTRQQKFPRMSRDVVLYTLNLAKKCISREQPLFFELRCLPANTKRSEQEAMRFDSLENAWTNNTFSFPHKAYIPLPLELLVFLPKKNSGSPKQKQLNFSKNKKRKKKQCYTRREQAREFVNQLIKPKTKQLRAYI